MCLSNNVINIKTIITGYTVDKIGTAILINPSTPITDKNKLHNTTAILTAL